MNESTITRQVMFNLQRQYPEIFFHKIADPRIGGYSTGTRAVDIVLCFKGIFVGLEFKIMKGRSIPLDRIRENQLITLSEIERAGGVGLLAIVRYTNPRSKSMFLIPHFMWTQMIKTTKKKSVRLDEYFKQYEVKQNRNGMYVNWDFSPLKKRVDDAISVLKF